MSNFTSPLCLEPHFSKRFALLLMITHCGALLLLLPVILPVEFALAMKLCIGLLVLASALHTTRRHLLLIDHPLCGCILRYDDGMRVQLQSGVEARIASGCYSHPQLVVLRIERLENGKVDTLIIFPDALDVQSFRHLCVHLRHADEPLRKRSNGAERFCVFLR
ncbi:MAG: protein YgfX [Pseudomonadota bacterium]